MRGVLLGLALWACDGTLSSQREPTRDAVSVDGASADALLTDAATLALDGAPALESGVPDRGLRVADAEVGDRPNVDGPASNDGPPDVAPALDAGSDSSPDAAPLGECPAAEPVHLEPEDWVAPRQGHAERRIRLAAGPGHYRRMVAEFDLRTTGVHGNWTQLVELRITAPPRGLAVPHRYGAYTFQNNFDDDTGMNTGWRSKAVLTVWHECLDFTQDKPDFQVRANTDYHVRFVVDAESGTTQVVLTAPDVRVVSSGVAASSMVPSLGRDLVLVFGIRTSHGDFDRGLRPPWGWTISNLTIDLLPGGPHGPGAPDCAGNPRADCR